MIGVRAGLALLVLTGTLAVLWAGAPLAGSAQGSPRLIFASDRAPDYYPAVYTIALAGGPRRNLSLDEHADVPAAMHGKQVVFDRAGDALYTVPLAPGGVARKLTDAPPRSVFLGAAWSPEGHEIAAAFGSTRTILVSIFLVDRAGRKLAQLHDASAPARWSADGTRLAYPLGGLTLRHPTVRVVDDRGRAEFSRAGSSAFWAPAAPRLAIVSDGGDAAKPSTVVTDEQGRTIRRFTGRALAFSPDGRSLILARDPSGVWLASVDTGELRRLPGGETSSATVSPDGRRVELQVATAVMVVNLSTGRVEAHLPAFGEWLPDSRRLVTSDALNVTRLVAASGRILRRIELAPAGERVEGVMVTPDGTTLVYAARSEHIHQLYELLPTGRLRRITTAAGVDHSDPAVSPDGRLIADSEFAAPCSNCGTAGIAVLPADGSGPARPIPGNGINAHPTWSSDGLRIAYALNDGTGPRVVIAPADGSQPALADGTRPPADLAGGAGGSEPSWAPDGSLIAAARRGIVVVASDGTGVRQLTGPLPAGSSPLQTHAPSWSPDGATIAFAGADGLYVMGRDGSNLHRIRAVSGIASVAWSPDGATITFAALCLTCTTSETRDIWTVRPDGSGLEDVVDGVADDTTPAWLPAA